MARAVVYALLATAFVVLMVCSPMINEKGHNFRIGQNRRLGYRFPIPKFDPLVVKMQRMKEEKELLNEGNNPINLEKNSAIEEDDIEYFSDDGKLNLTLRLIVLFPLIDNSPKNGKVSFEELEAWNREQVMERLMYTTRKKMNLHDKDRDGGVSFTEYLPQFCKEEIDRNDMMHGEAGWWMEQFKNADVDGNGILNLDEFNNFLHPQDSSNDKIQKWILRQKIKMMDDDEDGKLKYAEFSTYVYNIYKAYAEFETAATNLPTAEQKFEELDINKDQFLDVNELIPILRYIKPGELSYAKYYASYLIQKADDDRDGYLTVDEMVNHEDTFYTTVFDNSDDDFHDEL